MKPPQDQVVAADAGWRSSCFLVAHDPARLHSSFDISTIMRTRIARVCLAVGLILFASGFFVLGDCPEWYALAAAFTGISVWFGSGATRRSAIVCLLASIVVTGLEAYSKVNHAEKQREWRKKLEDKQNAAESNQPDSGKAELTSLVTVEDLRPGPPDPGR